MSKEFIEGLESEHGALHSGDIRYLLIRADALMGCFKPPALAGLPELYQAIEDSFSQFGGKSVLQYVDSSDSSTQQLWQKMEKMAPQLGWGQWSFAFGRTNGEIILTVSNSPFSAGHGSAEFAVCSPISGIVKSVAEQTFKVPVIVQESRCSAMSGDVCVFKAVVDTAGAV